VPVALQRSSVSSTRDKALWSLIRNRTLAIGSNEYFQFVDRVLCKGQGQEGEFAALRGRLTGRTGNAYGVSAYEVLKATTEIFLLTHGGAWTNVEEFDVDDEASRLGERLTLKELQYRLEEYL
jgi:hypothetical protein